MKSIIIGILVLALAVFIFIPGTALAVKEQKNSNVGGSHQVWFEAENFDSRDSATGYQLAKAEAKLVIPANTFGDAITDVAGSDAIWLRYDFDISKAGGKAGTWYFWGRVISPNNQSDFLWVTGQNGTTVPTVKPANIAEADAAGAFINRVLEETVTPDYLWIKTDHTEGHTKTLLAGKNTMVLFWRQSDNTVLFDVFMWADDPKYVPTDDDYKKASSLTAVKPLDKLSTTWGEMKKGF